MVAKSVAVSHGLGCGDAPALLSRSSYPPSRQSQREALGQREARRGELWMGDFRKPSGFLLPGRAACGWLSSRGVGWWACISISSALCLTSSPGVDGEDAQFMETVKTKRRGDGYLPLFLVQCKFGILVFLYC